ncbi:YidC/Oxa1 family insertase periplasmic-domain containing protein [Blattabacterium cuenoti]|uniref:YidC/Oxa1 family insertase periplasmic-domain containing protein n=1 Tax=Blattabacterium cuenoti TaxID=1653831 RepID=UPI00163CCBD3|nr:YidC/Oxa1 family insertase periplasmic-domain containing protein [Blattabacterium cuenoti]
MNNNRNLDYSSIIGFFLILIVLIVFTFFLNKNNFIEKKENEFFNQKANFLIRKRNIKERYSNLENDVLKLRISNIGGIIDKVFLKKYKSYDKVANSHVKNLFLVKKNSFLHRIFFSNSRNSKNTLSTEKIFFKPFIRKENDDYIILVMKAIFPNIKKGNLYYVYKIKKGRYYSVDFSIKMNNIPYNLSSLDFQQYLFSVEKDRNWENSYTKLYYLSSYKDDNNFVKNLSEKNIVEKNISNINWIAAKQQFFSTIIYSDKILKDVFIYSKNYFDGKILKKIYISTPLNKKKNKESNFYFHFYFGPLNFNILKKYENNFEDIIPFGWGILKYINKYFFLTIFQFLEKSNFSYGIIVILMTMVVKLLLYPITYKQYKLNAIMKLIRPDIEKLNNQFKDKDVIRKQQAIMELYKKVGINPMSGCLSALFQIPIFYSLFKFFPTLINLRGESFLWVDDLTSYDSILELPFSIPFYGNHVSLLTLLYSIALLVYTKISSNSEKGIYNNNEDSIFSNIDIMLYLMPFIMLLFINSYASALSLYYFTSNLINIIFFIIIKKFLLNEEKILLRIRTIK